MRSQVRDSPADADPAREHLILDADSTQQAAIDTVRSGAHLVIKGPPGTGKSQTIANLIASLAGEGKRVLFVAEKRAAIDAVLSRLARVGLSDLVLDAYDGASNKRRLAQQFGAALERGSAVADPDTSVVERALVERRGRLVEHARALHETREPWGVSAYQVQEAITTLSSRSRPPTSRVRVRGEQLAGLSRQRVEELARELTEAASLGRGPPKTAATRGTAPGLPPPRTPCAQDVTSRLSQGGLQDVRDTIDEVFAEVTMPPATRVADWGAVLDTVGRVRDTLEVFRPEVFDIPLADLVAATGSKEYREANGVAWAGTPAGLCGARSAPPAPRHPTCRPSRRPGRRTDPAGGRQQMAGAGGRPEIPSTSTGPAA